MVTPVAGGGGGTGVIGAATFVVALPVKAVFVLSVAVNVCEPPVLKVTEKTATPSTNEMLPGSFAAVSELVTRHAVGKVLDGLALRVQRLQLHRHRNTGLHAARQDEIQLGRHGRVVHVDRAVPTSAVLRRRSRSRSAGRPC